MKKVFLIYLAGSFSLVSCAQNKNVPEKVQRIFTEKYPTAQEVKWNKENADFEVSFDLDDKDVSIVYDANGKEKEVEMEIQKSELPQAVLGYLEEHQKGKKIKETAKITDANGKVSFEVEIKGKDLMFDEQGNLLK